MTTLPADIASLSMLSSARSAAADYYAPLLDSDDEVLKVGVIHMGAVADTGWEYYQAQAWRALEAAR